MQNSFDFHFPQHALRRLKVFVMHNSVSDNSQHIKDENKKKETVKSFSNV